jgi:threonylcarbamoyladenosine tRNA methylthiotransferase CDKAL1
MMILMMMMMLVVVMMILICLVLSIPHDDPHHIQRHFATRYRFPMLNISQFYPRPNTPAAKLKRLDGQTVKARSTEMTQLFESYSTWDHLVGATKKVPWFFRGW